jgi:hypothetical protein
MVRFTRSSLIMGDGPTEGREGRALARPRRPRRPSDPAPRLARPEGGGAALAHARAEQAG